MSRDEKSTLSSAVLVAFFVIVLILLVVGIVIGVLLYNDLKVEIDDVHRKCNVHTKHVNLIEPKTTTPLNISGDVMIERLGRDDPFKLKKKVLRESALKVISSKRFSDLSLDNVGNVTIYEMCCDLNCFVDDFRKTCNNTLSKECIILYQNLKNCFIIII